MSVELLDVGGLAGLMSVAGWAGALGERETQDERERVYKEGARIVFERERKGGDRSEYRVVLGNGVIVTAEGRGVELGALKRAVGRLDLKALEAAGKAG
jgi:hypothetical protein